MASDDISAMPNNSILVTLSFRLCLLVCLAGYVALMTSQTGARHHDDVIMTSLTMLQVRCLSHTETFV